MGRSYRSRQFRPIAWWVIGLGLLLVVGAGVVAVQLLLAEASMAGAEQRPALRIDAIKTALTVAAGTGGAAALLLATRRQWLAERAQLHTEDDAEERRVTELYTKAVEQLGSDRAPVRLGGLYALERLAQGNPPHRQTIVNVICAYLRMPYTRPDGIADSEVDRREELQVRMAAQRILAEHLALPPETVGPEPPPRLPRPDSMKQFWPGMSVDLTGAVLVDLDFAAVRLDLARFTRAAFHGTTIFALATFDALADFAGAEFHGDLEFGSCRFLADAVFRDTTFHGEVDFSVTDFRGMVTNFGRTTFSGRARFNGTTFGRPVAFTGAEFQADASFSMATFDNGSRHHLRSSTFEATTFHAAARFNATAFLGYAWFEQTAFRGASEFKGAQFHGDVEFKLSPESRPDLTDAYLMDTGHKRELPPGWMVEKDIDGVEYSTDLKSGEVIGLHHDVDRGGRLRYRLVRQSRR